MTIEYELTIDGVIVFPKGRERGGTRITPGQVEHWQRYQDWLAEGNTPDPIVPDPPPPTNEEVYDQITQRNDLIRGLVKALDNGDFPVGTNLGGPAVRNRITSNM